MRSLRPDKTKTCPSTLFFFAAHTEAPSSNTAIVRRVMEILVIAKCDSHHRFDADR